jgi:hypothetical protein
MDTYIPSSPPIPRPAWVPYDKHTTKPDYDRAFEAARRYVLEESHENEEGEEEDQLPSVAARIFHVKEDSLRQSIYRSRTKQRNTQGLFNKHGGNNKILDAAQERAIFQYCFNQWEMGMGATHPMVYASICHLKKVSNPIPSF